MLTGKVLTDLLESMHARNIQNMLTPVSSAGYLVLRANNETLSSVVFVVFIFSTLYDSLLFEQMLIIPENIILLCLHS